MYDILPVRTFQELLPISFQIIINDDAKSISDLSQIGHLAVTSKAQDILMNMCLLPYLLLLPISSFLCLAFPFSYKCALVGGRSGLFTVVTCVIHRPMFNGIAAFVKTSLLALYVAKVVSLHNH